MFSSLWTVNNSGLRARALGFGKSVVMGVAGSGPAYSLAATTAVLVGAVGVLAPASLLYCGLIMFGIVFAFRHLNRLDANAGATYSWLSWVFSPAIGFFVGWSVITGSALFMVSGSLPGGLGSNPRNFWNHLDSMTWTKSTWLVPRFSSV